MANRIQNEYLPEYAVPPGETLLEILEDRGMSQVELAERTGRPRKTINEIVQGKAAITPETALQLQHVLGIPASFWNNREQQYREALARVEERQRLISALSWLDEVPTFDLIEAKWIRRLEDPIDQLREVLSFYRVSSPKAWSQVWGKEPALFRRSQTFKGEPYAVSAWLCQGGRIAEQIETVPYDADKFRRNLDAIRSVTRAPGDTFKTDLKRLCADAGVAVVFVPELPRTYVSAATRWISPSKALIQLSLRYRTDDHLWFSFFHEAGHILLHGKRELFIEGNPDTDEKEEEANKFAENILISAKAWETLKEAAPYYSYSFIVRFAEEIGIAPGIVVGQLEHKKLVPFGHCRKLKKTFKWA